MANITYRIEEDAICNGLEGVKGTFYSCGIARFVQSHNLGDIGRQIGETCK